MSAPPNSMDDGSETTLNDGDEPDNKTLRPESPPADRKTTAGRAGATELMLPFVPTAEYELHDGGIAVWWFEMNFCQSMYGPHSSCHRNACTLIALLTAAKMLANASRQPDATAAADSAAAVAAAIGETTAAAAGKQPPHRMVRLFAESMLLGNRIYCEMEESKRLPHLYLNIPEAMEATAEWIENVEEWQSFVFMDELLSPLFYDHLNSTLNQWWSYENQIERPDPTNQPNNSARRAHVCVILIAECRSILLVFEQRPPRISVYDSHQHSATTGSCIARTSLDQLPALCKWIQSLFANIYHVRPTCFELSYIQTR